MSGLSGFDWDNYRWRKGPVDPGPAVVFDLDGVLSDAVSRQHYLEAPRRDWDAFFEACGDDPLIDEVGRLLELLDPTLAIVLLTARPVRVQPQTLAWLDRYGLRWDLLVMRDFGDYSSARRFKQHSVARVPAVRLRPGAGRSRTTGATWRCSAPRACRASTSTRATTTDAAGV